MSAETGGGIYRLRTNVAAEIAPAPGYAAPREPEGQPYANRIMLVLAGFALFGLVLAAQLVRYQAFGLRLAGGVVGGAGDVNPELPRGSIVNRHGHPLAIESYEYQVTVSPNSISDFKAAAEKLAPLLGMSATDIEQQLADHAQAAYLPLGVPVGPAVGEAILTWGDPAITAEPRAETILP